MKTADFDFWNPTPPVLAENSVRIEIEGLTVRSESSGGTR